MKLYKKIAEALMKAEAIPTEVVILIGISMSLAAILIQIAMMK